MQLRLMLCLALFFFSGCDRPKPFTFISDESFGLKATASATAAIAGPFLRVDVGELAIRAEPSAVTVAHVYKYTVGIAEASPQGGWQIVRRSTPMLADFRLSPGETRSLATARMVIPLDGLSDLQNKWLVIETDVDNGHRGFSYARTMALGTLLQVNPK